MNRLPFQSRVIGLDTPSGFWPTQPFSIHPLIVSDGWRAYIDSFIAPQIAAGVRNLHFQNPWGRGPNGSMDFDQYLRALSLGPSAPVNSTFTSAFRSLTEQSIGCTMHIGCPRVRANFKRWADDCVQPLITAGVGISLDAIVGEPDSGEVYDWVCELADRATVFVEAYPEQKRPGWARFNVVSLRDNFHQSQTDGWGVPLWQIDGEVRVMLDMPPAGRKWTETGWEGADTLGVLKQQGLSVIAQTGRMFVEQKLSWSKVFAG